MVCLKPLTFTATTKITAAGKKEISTALFWRQITDRS